MSFKPNSSSPAPLPVNSQETWLVSAVGPGSRGLPAGGGVPSPGPAAQPLPRPLFNDYGPPSLGYLSAGGGPQQPPQSKYAELLAVIEELGRDIRPTYAGSKSATERLKRGEHSIMHARALVRECLAETERSARS
ncbi:cyclin-dependent kinase 2-associated protein 1 isoform X1 [Petromyzon marinus]|uniref:Cyclin-dependent kinase 2-associated protein 1 isoform X1 n=1 Tax=Petromyzon marinus TaxID=7757 RepID=A0AAJ7SPP1_PETMA|nr:cyclin-dependent kinase 2-associated protein 1 isoform X1 [Petromyzon marinus]